MLKGASLSIHKLEKYPRYYLSAYLCSKCNNRTARLHLWKRAAVMNTHTNKYYWEDRPRSLLRPSNKTLMLNTLQH